MRELTYKEEDYIIESGMEHKREWERLQRCKGCEFWDYDELENEEICQESGEYVVCIKDCPLGKV